MKRLERLTVGFASEGELQQDTSLLSKCRFSVIPWEIFGVSSVILFIQQGWPQLWLKPLFHPWDLTVDVELTLLMS